MSKAEEHRAELKRRYEANHETHVLTYRGGGWWDRRSKSGIVLPPLRTWEVENDTEAE